MTDDDKEIKCPKCGAGNLRRIFSAFTNASIGATCAPSSPT